MTTKALASHDKAIALRPDYAEAHYNRGIVLHELDRLDDALASFDRGRRAQAGFHAAAHNNRGTVLLDLSRLEEAVAAFDTAVAMTSTALPRPPAKQKPLSPAGRPLRRRFVRLHEWLPEDPNALRLVMGVIYQTYPSPRKRVYHQQTVFVHWEQGFGDTCNFAATAKLLRERGANVVMSVQEPLYRLLSHSMPDIRFLKADAGPAAFDYHCALMSCRWRSGQRCKTCPLQAAYLFADDERRKIWEARMPAPTPSKPRVGLVWNGNAKQKNDINRSVGLAALAPDFGYRCALDFVAERESKDIDRPLLENFRQGGLHYGELLTDFSDTAALIAASGFGHHRRNERRAPCQRDGKAGVG